MITLLATNKTESIEFVERDATVENSLQLRNKEYIPVYEFILLPLSVKFVSEFNTTYYGISCAINYSKEQK